MIKDKIKGLDQNMKIVTHYSSHKNEVLKAKYGFHYKNKYEVIKIYKNRSSSFKEYNNLIKLKKHGLNVPKALKYSNTVLFLEFIQGDLVNDLVEKLDSGTWIEELARWMVKLHKITSSEGSFLKKDCNLKNFIYSNGKIYGLDLEDEKYGDPREDIGELCFFILTNHPSLTHEKIVMYKRFINAYKKYSGLKLHNINHFILKSAERARIRRMEYSKNLFNI